LEVSLLNIKTKKLITQQTS